MMIDDEEISLGSAEIRLASQGGAIFAAPDLICHYVAIHGYCPPDEFLAALGRRKVLGTHSYPDRGWNVSRQCLRNL
jgi:hypothetical protein